MLGQTQIQNNGILEIPSHKCYQQIHQCKQEHKLIVSLSTITELQETLNVIDLSALIVDTSL